MIRKIFLLAIIGLLSLISYAKADNNAIDKFFDKYSQLENATYVNFTPSPDMMESLIPASVDSSKDLGNILRGIRAVKVLSIENSKVKHKKGVSKTYVQNYAGEAYQAAKKVFPLKEYKKFLEVKEKGSNVNMLYKGEGGKVREFLMLVDDRNETTIIWINGVINLKDLSKLSKLTGKLGAMSGAPIKGTDDKPNTKK